VTSPTRPGKGQQPPRSTREIEREKGITVNPRAMSLSESDRKRLRATDLAVRQTLSRTIEGSSQLGGIQVTKFSGKTITISFLGLMQRGNDGIVEGVRIRVSAALGVAGHAPVQFEVSGGQIADDGQGTYAPNHRLASTETDAMGIAELVGWTAPAGQSSVTARCLEVEASAVLAPDSLHASI
jgi:hypothetical protein